MSIVAGVRGCFVFFAFFVVYVRWTRREAVPANRAKANERREDAGNKRANGIGGPAGNEGWWTG